MRALALAACLFTGLSGAAFAMPAAPIEAPGAIVQVQLQCSPQSCIDPRTGIYTQSTCDRYGCRPISGPVGRLGGPQPSYGGGYGGAQPYYGGGYDDDRPRRRRGWDDDGGRYRRGGYGGSGFDCNASRCIAPDGSLWMSTCDRRGCRPLRPAY